MRRAATLAVAVAVGAALSGCSSPPTDPEQLATQMFELTNEQRVDQGLKPVEWSECLAKKAKERAEPFVNDADLEHALLVSTCHEGAKAGENLSRTDESAAQVVDLWMNSAGHRANILDPEFTIGAIACVAADPQADGGDSGVRACSLLYEGPAQ
ncbi:CAP domain-containing protein [Demequina soli]|uniref:CAP domain-containing protein n=1 Tax=Demequina soli TaxID=1638987 RepID=UPI000A7C010D|nr:CAP domain-containing protein [Demequina soli]